MEQLISELLLKYPVLSALLSVGGMLVVCATAYVSMTPSKDDDAFVEKIKSYPFVGVLITFFEAHSLVERKKQ